MVDKMKTILGLLIVISVVVAIRAMAGYSKMNDATEDMHLAPAKIILFHGQKFDDHEVYHLKTSMNILKHSQFDMKKKTVLYCHGYMETLNSESTHVVVDSYVRNGGYNVLVLDWSDLSNGNYFLEAIPNTRRFGRALGHMVIKFLLSGVDIKKFHLVGHSLGAQLAGIIGRTVHYGFNGKKLLKRITALDPAFPPFYPALVIPHISASDAEFVDVIHTDAGFYGAPVSTGTVDFWPNGGKFIQPGCPSRNYLILTERDLCSHRRSWRYWAESVAAGDRDTFYSVRCATYFDFLMGACNHHYPAVQMGNNCPTGINGSYYLQTNGQSPFSKSFRGIKSDVDWSLTGILKDTFS